jgi:hypothetical protein
MSDPYRAVAPAGLSDALRNTDVGPGEELALLGPGGVPFALALGDGAAVRELVRLANAGAAAEAWRARPML